MRSRGVQVRFGLASLVAFSLVVAACGGSDDADSSSDEPTVTTSVDEFYAFDDFGSAAPGTLIQSVEVDAPAGIKAWRVLYHSQAVDGADIPVSGTIAVAEGDAPAGGRPVISWAHGTAGLADQCAPSKADDPVADIPGAQAFLDAGYVVAATDYEGLGTPGTHPYLVGESEGRGVLDIARAAQKLGGTDASNELAIFGHSQGGHAALFAGQIAPTYAPDLDLVGVAAGAPVGDLALLLPVASSIPEFLGYVLMGGFGFSAAYDNTNLDQILLPAAYEQGRTAIETMCSTELNEEFDRDPATVIAKNPSEVPPWPELLTENTPGNAPTEAPLFVFQGDADELVPLFSSEAYVARACALGDTIEFKVYPGEGHGSVVKAALPDAEAWITARINGDEPVPTSCP